MSSGPWLVIVEYKKSIKRIKDKDYKKKYLGEAYFISDNISICLEFPFDVPESLASVPVHQTEHTRNEGSVFRFRVLATDCPGELDLRYV